MYLQEQTHIMSTATGQTICSFHWPNFYKSVIWTGNHISSWPIKYSCRIHVKLNSAAWQEAACLQKQRRIQWNTHSKIGQHEFIQSWKGTVIEFIKIYRKFGRKKRNHLSVILEQFIVHFKCFGKPTWFCYSHLWDL